jgi:DNA polymerase-3 subunit beta
MKFKVQRDALLVPLLIVGNVVERRQTTPILANVLLRVKGNQLTLTGTDSEVQIIASAKVESIEDGDITLPARKLIDLCKSLPDGAQLDITIDKEKAIIRSGRSRFTLATMPAMEFPEIDSITFKSQFELPQQNLKILIEQTQFAMAQQDVRYYLNGLMFDVTEGSVTTVATDGHRLACCTHTTKTNVSAPQQVIIPRKGIQELLRLLEPSKDLVAINISQNHLQVKLKEVTFTTKLIDAKFPDYQQVIPKNANNEMRVTRVALLQAFTRVAILSNEKFRGMRFHLAKQLLKVSVHNPEQEEAEEEIEVNYSAAEFEIGFNISYFLDVLSIIKTEEVGIYFTDANSSCLLKGIGDDQCRYVIMPMRL